VYITGKRATKTIMARKMYTIKYQNFV